MTDYRSLYLLLFNSITDALKNLDDRNYGFARFTLTEAQKRAEELFIEAGEE
jgi:hypothetical protein